MLKCLMFFIASLRRLGGYLWQGKLRVMAYIKLYHDYQTKQGWILIINFSYHFSENKYQFQKSCQMVRLELDLLTTQNFESYLLHFLFYTITAIGNITSWKELAI